MNTKYFAYLKAAYFSSNLIGCQLKITLFLTAAPPLFLSLLFVDVAADFGSWMFLSRIFCTLMINMLLSSHSKNMAYFSRFSNFLWIFPSAKASGNMFQRKLEKLEKYLPYFFRDWTIIYIYLRSSQLFFSYSMYGINL